MQKWINDSTHFNRVLGRLLRGLCSAWFLRIPGTHRWRDVAVFWGILSHLNVCRITPTPRINYKEHLNQLCWSYPRMHEAGGGILTWNRRAISVDKEKKRVSQDKGADISKGPGRLEKVVIFRIQWADRSGLWVKKGNDVVTERNKPREASGEQLFRTLKRSAKRLDFITNVTEMSQRMSLMNSHYKVWASQKEGRFRFCQQSWLGACRVKLIGPGWPRPPCA